MTLDETGVAALRKEFPALCRNSGGTPLVFFDGPGGTQVHRSVISAMTEYLTDANSNAHGNFERSRRTDEITYQARVAMADFLNAPFPEEIVFGPNMTTLTFRMSEAIGRILDPGDEVVVTRLDHDANIAPWVALQERGVVVRFVDFDVSDCTLNMREMERTVSKKTRLVAVGYASNAVGTINDVAAVTELAHASGAWVYVDAVHYAPHGPIDVERLGCDFLACSPYKFFGPHLGVLYARYEIQEMLLPRKVRPAGNAPPGKFETGTNNFEGICGAAASVDYLASVGERYGVDFLGGLSGYTGRRRKLKAGMAAIRRYEIRLFSELLSGIREIPKLRLYGITDKSQMQRRVPTLSFRMDGRTPREVARALDGKGIFVWDGNFYAPSVTERLGLEETGGLVRAGLCHYNTNAELRRFLEAVEETANGCSSGDPR